MAKPTAQELLAAFLDGSRIGNTHWLVDDWVQCVCRTVASEDGSPWGLHDVLPMLDQFRQHPEDWLILDPSPAPEAESREELGSAEVDFGKEAKMVDSRGVTKESKEWHSGPRYPAGNPEPETDEGLEAERLRKRWHEEYEKQGVGQAKAWLAVAREASRMHGEQARVLQRHLRRSNEELSKTRAELEKLEELVVQFKECSGLISGGDPDGVTPEGMRRYWEGVESERDQLKQRVAQLVSDFSIEGDHAHSSEPCDVVRNIITRVTQAAASRTEECGELRTELERVKDGIEDGFIAQPEPAQEGETKDSCKVEGCSCDSALPFTPKNVSECNLPTLMLCEKHRDEFGDIYLTLDQSQACEFAVRQFVQDKKLQATVEELGKRVEELERGTIGGAGTPDQFRHSGKWPPSIKSPEVGDVIPNPYEVTCQATKPEVG